MVPKTASLMRPPCADRVVKSLLMRKEAAIPENERAYLRELAKKQAEYAALPVMAERRKMWYDLNDGSSRARPPVVVETWTFDRDFMPESVYRCATPAGRSIEYQLLARIRNHELIDDDKVVPDTFDMGWAVSIDEFGVEIEVDHRKDAQGVETAYRYHHPITDLERDFPKLKPAVCRVDREATGERRAFLESLLGDILPVRLRTGIFGGTMLTNRVIELMGMEAYFIAMYEAPDSVHRLMGFLRDNALKVMRWAESEGLLRLNNENQDSFGSSTNFTRRLPAPGFRGEAARLCDMWGCANSQETVGVSPAMFSEFCFPYYRDVTEPMGLLYYGCCEPVSPFWKDISRLPHLKKVSVSKWCDQKLVGEALRGSGIVYSRKPDPNLLGVDVKLNEAGFSAHIRETLDAAQGCFLEILFRDVYTVHGDLNKPRRAVELTRAEIARHWKS